MRTTTCARLMHLICIVGTGELLAVLYREWGGGVNKSLGHQGHPLPQFQCWTRVVDSFLAQKTNGWLVGWLVV